MTDKNRFEARSFVERLLERENAKHEIQPSGHLRDASAVPRPNLRANVKDNPDSRKTSADGLSQAEIKAGIVDQDECLWREALDLCEDSVELGFEVTILLQDIPEAHDCFVGPVANCPIGKCPHLLAARSGELD